MWREDLEAVLRGHDRMSIEEFSDALARTLERRELLLKLLSVNLYDMEANSRMERLVAFKTAYGDSMGAVTRCLEKFFPANGGGGYPAVYLWLFPIPVRCVPLYRGDG